MSLKPPDPQTVVIFGATGDLTARKLMPALYNLYTQELLPDGFAIIGYARSEMSSEQFREGTRVNIEKHSRTGLDHRLWEGFASHLSYVRGEFSSERAMNHLAGHLQEAGRDFGCEGCRFFYCATPPSALPMIAKRLGEEGLRRGSRIVVEKPLGHDPASARALNRALHEVFEEDQIYR
ncbi:MAG: glucose-6-phosphate dehydrogenase, partial [Actinomycetota bacterium]